MYMQQKHTQIKLRAMETPDHTYSLTHSSSFHWQQETPAPSPAYRSALHSVRKKVITKKLPIAPLPPTPPKIYKVDPLNFRDVVQRLTAAPEFQRRRLRELAPPPLSLSHSHPPPSASALAWCSSILLSPGTLSSFETSAVL